MSTVSSTSTSSKTDKLLSDMITRLQAIEAKQDRMGEQLKGLDPLREKVASLEAVTTEISATQVTIVGAVERIGRAQLTLHNKVNRLETEQSATHAGRRPTGGGGLNDTDGDTMPIYLTDAAQLWFRRLELNGDQLSWTDFMHWVNSRFGPPLSASTIEQFAWLRCTGNVNDYTACFMELSCRDEY
jgi:hypothetical protein